MYLILYLILYLLYLTNFISHFYLTPTALALHCYLIYSCLNLILLVLQMYLMCISLRFIFHSYFIRNPFVFLFLSLIPHSYFIHSSFVPHLHSICTSLFTLPLIVPHSHIFDISQVSQIRSYISLPHSHFHPTYSYRRM